MRPIRPMTDIEAVKAAIRKQPDGDVAVVLSEHERDAYHKRCTDRGIELTADDRISRHFVEIIDGGEPPLSSERRV